MPQQNLHLQRVFSDAFRQLGRGRRRLTPDANQIEVRFYPYAGLHHTIRVRAGRVYVRLSDLFRTAPPEVIRALAFLLVARLLSRKAPPTEEQIYRSYALSPQLLRASDLARRQRGRKVVSSARGQVYDLERIFARVNRRHFENAIAKPVLTWSQRRARSILGHHDAAHDTITISKALDSREVPEWFVEYILYHEMLHLKHPVRLRGSRRCVHSPEFQAEERMFPDFERVKRFLKILIKQVRQV